MKKELSYFEEQYNAVVSARDKLVLKTGLCLLVCSVFGGLTMLNLPRVPLAILQLVSCVLIAWVCRVEITDGLRSFLKLSPSTDSFHSLALLATVAHSIYMMAANPPSDGHFFCQALFLSITISMGMKYVYVLQIIKNLDLIRDKKTYSLQVTDLSLSKKYIRQVCSANPVVDFPNVVRTSFDSDPTEKKNRKFVPLVALAVIALSVLISLLHKGLFLVSFTSMLVICASFTAEMSFVLPYILMQIRLRKLGSILMGNYSIEHLKEADTLLVKDTDLFPSEGNEILNFRIRKKALTQEVLQYTAALLKLSQSPLEYAFRNENEDIGERMPTVLDWRIIKNYGIVATINIDNVLLGNRNLLLSHNIQPWSPDKEAMLTAAGVHLMYLAINGEIAATLIVRYKEDPELKKSAQLLGGDFNLLVETMDCNINESMIQRRYDLSHTKISVPDPDEAESVNETREELEEDQSPPVMLSTQNALGILESIRRAKQLHKTVSVCIAIQQLSILFGVLLTAVALLVAPGQMSWAWPFLFHLIWAVPVLIVSLFRKN